MRIEKTKNKIKIILEYLPKISDFGTIYQEDLDKLYFKVFLKEGGVIMVDEIKMISFSIKDDELSKIGDGSEVEK